MPSRFLRSPAQRIRVLLCDDVEAFRALIRHSLAAVEDIDVVGEAEDGLDGIRQAADLQPDVVLLDLSMPRCDGLEAIPEITERSPATRIVALSGYTAERMAAPALGHGAAAYLEKGTEVAEIVATIRGAAAV